MINFLIFSLSFLANLLVITFIPNDYTKEYINIYTLVGGVAALTFFLIYASTTSIKLLKLLGYSLLFILVILNLFLSSFWAAAAVYPALLVYTDYISSQSDLVKYNRAYRIFLIASALPLAVFQNHFLLLFSIRTSLIGIILALYLLNTKAVTKLEVRSTWKYIFFNYSFYYVPLLLIANLPIQESHIKLWYIFSQGGFIVYLKYLDFCLRRDRTSFKALHKIILAASIIAPAVPSALHPSATGIAIYFIGLSGLIYSKRYIKT